MPDAAAAGEARAGCSPPAAQTPAGDARSRLPSGEVGRGRYGFLVTGLFFGVVGAFLYIYIYRLQLREKEALVPRVSYCSLLV